MRHVKSLILLVPLAGAVVPSVAFAVEIDKEKEANWAGTLEVPTPLGPIIIKGCGNGDCPKE